MTQKIPFRFDIVGSFLRPAELKQARADLISGEISQDQLTEVEDRLISELMNQQSEVGLQAVTDGEFRRKWWHLDFIASLKGIEVFDIVLNAFGKEDCKMQSYYLAEPLSFPENHPFIEHFKRNAALAGERLVKQTIPGPGMVYLTAVLKAEQYRKNPVYKNLEGFEVDLVDTYRKAIDAFYQAGCRYLQLDDTSWGAFFSPQHTKELESLGYDIDILIDRFADVMEAAIADKPEDLALTTHMCKGNFMSSWLYEGSYDRIARRLLGLEHFDGFFLEYDDERSGSFEPLQYLKNQRMVLGLVTTKCGEMEEKETVLRRIEQAAEIVPMDQICISPQCGFASTEEGNALAYEEQWKKLRFLKDIADEVWG